MDLRQLDKWKALPAAYQEALEVACAEANVQMHAKYDARNTEALRRLSWPERNCDRSRVR